MPLPSSSVRPSNLIGEKGLSSTAAAAIEISHSSTLLFFTKSQMRSNRTEGKERYFILLLSPFLSLPPFFIALSLLFFQVYLGLESAWQPEGLRVLQIHLRRRRRTAGNARAGNKKRRKKNKGVWKSHESCQN